MYFNYISVYFSWHKFPSGQCSDCGLSYCVLQWKLLQDFRIQQGWGKKINKVRWSKEHFCFICISLVVQSKVKFYSFLSKFIHYIHFRTKKLSNAIKILYFKSFGYFIPTTLNVSIVFFPGDAKVLPCEFHVRRIDRPKHHRPNRHGFRPTSTGSVRNPALQEKSWVYIFMFANFKCTDTMVTRRTTELMIMWLKSWKFI